MEEYVVYPKDNYERFTKCYLRSIALIPINGEYELLKVPKEHTQTRVSELKTFFHTLGFPTKVVNNGESILVFTIDTMELLEYAHLLNLGEFYYQQFPFDMSSDGLFITHHYHLRDEYYDKLKEEFHNAVYDKFNNCLMANTESPNELVSPHLYPVITKLFYRPYDSDVYENDYCKVSISYKQDIEPVFNVMMDIESRIKCTDLFYTCCDLFTGKYDFYSIRKRKELIELYEKLSNS